MYYIDNPIMNHLDSTFVNILLYLLCLPYMLTYKDDIIKKTIFVPGSWHTAPKTLGTLE